MYDASFGGLAKVRLQLNSDPSDNPMASEIAGHIGGKGNHFCRKCNVGGTMLEKETDSGYHDLFLVRSQPLSVLAYETLLTSNPAREATKFR